MIENKLVKAPQIMWWPWVLVTLRYQFWRHTFGSKVLGAKILSNRKLLDIPRKFMTSWHPTVHLRILKEQTAWVGNLTWKCWTSGRIVQGRADRWPESHRGHCCLRLGLYALLHLSQHLAFPQAFSNSTLRRSLAPHEDLCRCNNDSRQQWTRWTVKLPKSTRVLSTC